MNRNSGLQTICTFIHFSFSARGLQIDWIAISIAVPVFFCQHAHSIQLAGSVRCKRSTFCDDNHCECALKRPILKLGILILIKFFTFNQLTMTDSLRRTEIEIFSLFFAKIALTLVDLCQFLRFCMSVTRCESFAIQQKKNV